MFSVSTIFYTILALVLAFIGYIGWAYLSILNNVGLTTT